MLHSWPRQSREPPGNMWLVQPQQRSEKKRGLGPFRSQYAMGLTKSSLYVAARPIWSKSAGKRRPSHKIGVLWSWRLLFNGIAVFLRTGTVDWSYGKGGAALLVLFSCPEQPDRVITLFHCIRNVCLQGFRLRDMHLYRTLNLCQHSMLWVQFYVWYRVARRRGAMV